MRPAVKLPTELLVAAEAAAAARGVATNQQIEIWVQLGRVLEGLAARVQPSSESVAAAPTLPILEETVRILDELCASPKRPTVSRHLDALLAAGHALYEVDPEDSDGLVQVKPDGTRRRGRFIDGEFVASASQVPGS